MKNAKFYFDRNFVALDLWTQTQSTCKRWIEMHFNVDDDERRGEKIHIQFEVTLILSFTAKGERKWEWKARRKKIHSKLHFYSAVKSSSTFDLLPSSHQMVRQLFFFLVYEFRWWRLRCDLFHIWDFLFAWVSKLHPRQHFQQLFCLCVQRSHRKQKKKQNQEKQATKQNNESQCEKHRFFFFFFFVFLLFCCSPLFFYRIHRHSDSDFMFLLFFFVCLFFSFRLRRCCLYLRRLALGQVKVSHSLRSQQRHDIASEREMKKKKIKRWTTMVSTDAHHSVATAVTTVAAIVEASAIGNDSNLLCILFVICFSLITVLCLTIFFISPIRFAFVAIVDDVENDHPLCRGPDATNQCERRNQSFSGHWYVFIGNIVNEMTCNWTFFFYFYTIQKLDRKNRCSFKSNKKKKMSKK